MKLPWLIFALVLSAAILGRWILGPGLPSLSMPMVGGFVVVLALPKTRLRPITIALLLAGMTSGVLLHLSYLSPAVAAGCAVVACAAVSVLVIVRTAVGTLLAAALLIPLLGWPILFSRHLPAAPHSLLDAGIYLNPLMALSAVARDLPPWTELPAIYPRTSLGQDVGYVRPTARATVLGYGLTGLVSAAWWAGSAARWVRRQAPVRPASPHPETLPTPEADQN
jgi:hypothetical protein